MHRLLRKHFHLIVAIAEPVVDFSSFVLGYLIGYGLHRLVHQDPGFPLIPYVKFSLVVAVMGTIIFALIGLYTKQASLMNIVEVRKILRANFILGLIVLSLSFALEIDCCVLLLLLATASAITLTTVERMTFYKLHQSFNLQGSRMRRVIIIGAGEPGRLLYQNIRTTPKLGYRVVGFFDEDDSLLFASQEWYRNEQKNGPLFWRTMAELRQAIKEHRIDEVFIARPSLTPDRIQKLMYDLKKLEVKFSYVPYSFGHFVQHLHIKDIGGIPLFSLEKIEESKAEKYSKNLLDFLVGSIALLLLSPLFLVIAALVKRDSPGPVFFKQVRSGKDGKEFQLYKFRTMYVDSPVYSISPNHADDPRITKIGHFLRRTSLDELPQLINVIRGEMSLVGPRPEMPFIVAQYNELQRERLRVKPGITGVWQISADRTREIHENISYDLFYIENRSLLLDMIIIVRTMIYLVFYAKTY